MWGRNEQLTYRESDGIGLNGGVGSRNQMDRLNVMPDAMPATVFEPKDAVEPALLRFFGLKQQPFGVTPDPSFLYLSRTHREALASLVYGIETGRGFLALMAKPGMGKTTLLFHLLEKFRSSARTAFIFQTQCTSREFLQFLSSDLGFTDGGSQDFVRMHEEFNYHLTREVRAGKRFIVVVDEAQNLDTSVLETIRLLSNFETPRAKLMQIVLSGQLELRDKLASRGMAQLHQRVSIMNRLEPLSPADTEQYVQHRLRVAGYSGNALLTSDALATIQDFSNGIPRKINNACFNALSLAFALHCRTIDAAIAREAIGDLELSVDLEAADEIEENAVVNAEASRDLRKSTPAVATGGNGSGVPTKPAHLEQNEVTCSPADSPDAPQPCLASEEEVIGDLSIPKQVVESTPAGKKAIFNSAPAFLVSVPNVAAEGNGKAEGTKAEEVVISVSPAAKAKEVPTTSRPESSAPDVWIKRNGEILSLADAKAYMNHFIRNLKSTSS
jgi:type II secretory pathway predicted ATPase ExeA